MRQRSKATSVVSLNVSYTATLVCDHVRFDDASLHVRYVDSAGKTHRCDLPYPDVLSVCQQGDAYSVGHVVRSTSADIVASRILAVTKGESGRFLKVQRASDGATYLINVDHSTVR